MDITGAIGAALGIGKAAQKTSIVALRDTVLKRFPVDSSSLGDADKMPFFQRDRLEIVNYKKVDNHIKFLTLELRYLGSWYAFADHVQIDDPNIPVLITLDQLAVIAPYTAIAQSLAPLIEHLNITMARYHINTPLRKAHFLAQIAHESDGFNTTREYASGTDYEWRDDLGNIYEGDGVKFRGRGLIQVTGRANYKSCGDALGIDLIANPSRLEDYDLACLSAGWFWNQHGLNIHADFDDIRKITRVINGGFNGLQDRINYLNRAKKVFGI